MTRWFWTADEDAALLRLVEARTAWAAIASETGRSHESCRSRRQILERRAVRSREAAAKGLPPPRLQQPWSDADCTTLLRLRDVEHLDFTEIDRVLGRRAGCSGFKYRVLMDMPARPKFVTGERAMVLSAAQIADRDELARLRHHSITAALCGDPLPGRSALDQRNSGAQPS